MHSIYHRHGKILKVGGAEDTVARKARAKNFRLCPAPTFGQTTPIFARSRLLSQCSQEFLDERTNTKSSRVDLAATCSHIDS